MTRLALMAALVCMLVRPCFAYTYHVYWDDSIQDGIDAVSAGDTVLVHPGTYYESITLAHRVNVWSTNGAASTTIDGGGSQRTVYSPSTADSLQFGGPNAGFTIKGGTTTAVHFDGSDHVHVEQLLVESDPSSAGVYVAGCASTTDFEDIAVSGITGANTRGLWLWQSDSHFEEILISDIADVGLYVNAGSAEFEEVQIDTCDTGVWVYQGSPSFAGGNGFSVCTTGVFVEAYDDDASVSLDEVPFAECTTGISAYANPGESASITVDGCDFTGCGDGILLGNAYGAITGCSFADVHGDGIVVSEASATIGGAGSGVNVFDGVDGTGIYVSTGADADIDSCYFSEVEETAIHVNSGSGGTTIDKVEMDGAGDCFEGIYTRVSNTFAEVRDCRMYDYQAAVSPPTPRGACVTSGATADFGTRDDHGNNDFHDNNCDLQYANRDTYPDSLYAVGNWWGESPPDGASFCGRTDYIVYTPYRTTQPKLMPVTEPDLPMPDVANLVSIHPSPSRGTVEFTYALPAADQVTLDILDLSGRLIATIEDGPRPAGFAAVRWNGRTSVGDAAAAGVYLCRMTTSATADTFRFVLVR